MINIDSLKEIRRVDKVNVLGSIEELPRQCEDAWKQASKIEIPDSYRDINNIVMTGMGGSGLGARIIESVYHEDLKFPLVRINDYDLPAYVDHHTLVICSSYSGTTEEPVSTARQAIEKNAKWMAIGTGNTLIELAKDHGVPYYKINPKYNPSNQPRMAIGYSVIGQLVMAGKVGLFDIKHDDIKNIINVMKGVQKDIKVEVKEKNNRAKKLARNMIDRNICYVASRHLVGAVHVVNNQLNENAKVFSADFQIPELNHHLMEGLTHPSENPNRLYFIFANSDLYPEIIQKRLKITQDVVRKNSIEYYEYKLKSKEKLEQAFEIIQFGSYVNFYLAMLYEQNPGPIPWVDYFKIELGQPLGK